MSPSEINRANARHSTGPKTTSGKQRSSLNALRHGLTSQVVVMPTEDLVAYRAHLKSFLDEYQPQGATEASLVQSLADASWRLNRIVALETNLLTLAAARQPDPLADAPNPVQEAMALALSFESQSKALANLSLHTQRLSRQFERTVTQLREIQKTRQVQEKTTPQPDGFVFSAAGGSNGPAPCATPVETVPAGTFPFPRAYDPVCARS